MLSGLPALVTFSVCLELATFAAWDTWKKLITGSEIDTINNCNANQKFLTPCNKLLLEFEDFQPGAKQKEI